MRKISILILVVLTIVAVTGSRGFAVIQSIHGTDSDDFSIGTSDNDLMLGGGGGDQLWGAGGNDILIGGSGDDVIEGNAGDDTIRGGGGNDVLTSGPGSDFVRGGDGDDVLYYRLAEHVGTSSTDRYNGDSGSDTLIIDLSGFDQSAMEQAFEKAFDRYLNSAEDRMFDLTRATEVELDCRLYIRNIEHLKFIRPPVAGDDNYVTSHGTSVIIYPLANDFDPNGEMLAISGLGDPEHGTVTRDSRENFSNLLHFTPDPDYVGPDSFTYVVESESGKTALAQVTIMVGCVAGTWEDDFLYGGAERDCILGYEGHDHLWGGESDDVIRGGPGNDEMIGGKGSDRFVFPLEDISDALQTDKISDFEAVAGGDILDLTGLLVGLPSSLSSQELTAYLKFTVDGNDTILGIDIMGFGGGGGFDHTIVLKNVFLSEDSATVLSTLVTNGNLVIEGVEIKASPVAAL